MRKLYYAFALLLTVKAYGADNASFAQLREAIDNKDATQVEKLAKAVTLTEHQKDILTKMSQQWLTYYEGKSKGFWRNGADFLKILGGLGLIGGGIASGKFAVQESNDQNRKFQPNYTICKIFSGTSACLLALGSWITYRGWRQAYTFDRLSKARRIAEAIFNIPVE